MPDKTVDLILHPLRLRILLAMGDNRLTARQIAQMMPDVAQATLYRHINALAEGHILQIVEENPVRGTVEKVYALPDAGMLNLSADDMAHASKSDHMRYFTVFAASLLGDYARYLQSTDEPDLAADGVGYHKHAIYLSDDEFMTFGKQLGEIMMSVVQNKPGQGRKRRLLSLIMMPDHDEPAINDTDQ